MQRSPDISLEIIHVVFLSFLTVSCLHCIQTWSERNEYKDGKHLLCFPKGLCVCTVARQGRFHTDVTYKAGDLVKDTALYTFWRWHEWNIQTKTPCFPGLHHQILGVYSIFGNIDKHCCSRLQDPSWPWTHTLSSLFWLIIRKSGLIYR